MIAGIPTADLLIIVALMIASLLAFRQLGILRQRLHREHTSLEKAVREGTEMRAVFYAVLQQVPAGVIVARASSFELIAANQQAARILGRPISSCVEAEPLWLPGPAAERDQFPFVRSMQHGETLIGEEMHYRGPAGRETTLEVNSSPILDDAGQVMGGVLVFQELTWRRLEQRAHLDLASVVNASDDAIYMLDLKGTVLTWNPGARRIYGYERFEIVGRDVSILLPPGHESEIKTLLERIDRGERLDAIDTTRVRKDGVSIPMSVRYSPTLLNGQVRSISVVGRDMTAWKRVSFDQHG